ncbi:MAG: 50S ribosomal protein L21 [Chloroflexi bacterium]|nr:50S ribosomal protein L21 [Chloroflexota bacterium]
MYAIVESGGKQYRVTEGQTLDLELLHAPEGETVELDKVLLLEQDGAVALGKPYVAGARVLAEVVGEVKGDKLIVFKYKPKVRYRRKTGHRQHYTRVQVKTIQSP